MISNKTSSVSLLYLIDIDNGRNFAKASDFKYFKLFNFLNRLSLFFF